MADEIKEQLSPDPGRRGAMFQGLTGRSGSNVSGTAGDVPDIRGMLRAAYGPGPRSDINTAAAAKGLGVSKRTVERWLADPSSASKISKPKPATVAKMAKAARQAATTKAGRKRVMKAMRESKEGKRLLKRGGRVRVTGNQGVFGKSAYYIRWRKDVPFPPNQAGMTPAEIEGLWTAYEQGGDKAASQWLTDYAREHYAAGWEFESIERIGYDPN
ncbi:terminal protein [Nocardia transvalensis]|uniref:terminal protein n=1 Tax=Nocardia transvalensis TaxID=37333 RepID=UPI0018942797|nr:terminal protein [Nocardia transvalensis]MBF6333646.1 terminal protein [Nocardia transvalensis]